MTHPEHIWQHKKIETPNKNTASKEL